LIEAAAPDKSEAEVDDEETSVLMYTSGTTSKPKGVMLSYRDFTAYVTANVEMTDGSDRGAALVCVPFYHIAGMTALMTNLWTGRRMIVMPQFEAGQWLRLVARERVTHAFVVPTMMKQLLDHPDFPRTDLSSLHNLAYGGAPMPFAVIRRAIEAFPRAVGFVNAYGQTETTSSLTMLGPDDHRLAGTSAELELKLKRLHSIGRPLPDVEVRVRDETGGWLERDAVGEIVIRTPRIMKGYAGREDDAALAEGWRATGDLGWIDADGYIFFAGRKDDLIIRGGENIAPAEIEAVLMSHPAVDEAAVVGAPSLEWGETVKAFVVVRPAVRTTAEELVDFCRDRLASFKRPERIEFVAELPKNPLGKILRQRLREQAS
ncbi:MAG TPA: AMP-binding protein, partial [Candidatus Binataceae bacterium]|nr:AMP-binding protein [Candidatus Binataceae bacterium]